MIIIGSSSLPTLQTLYNNLIADVYTLTKRPDLIAETALAIRKATMKAHSADMWKNDISTAIIILPVLPLGSQLSFRYAVDLTNVANFPLFRKVSSIDEYNTIPTGQELHFKELDSDRILDNYATEDINYWYQMGKQVNLRANKNLTYLSVDYYQYPNITPALYTSWIAQEFPDIIVCEAAANIFKTIGKDNEAASYGNMFAGTDGESGHLHMLRMSEI